MGAEQIVIRRIVGTGWPPEVGDQVDSIFFEASGRSAFDSAEARTAFRERWLGRYLKGGSDIVLLAQDASDAVAGYLVGAIDDPAGQSRFADISYFRSEFRELCRRFPAHLHINLAPAFRSRGVGARLIASFAGYAASAGAPGFHVVTARSSRNVSFYRRCGLAEAGAACWNGRDVVFLAKALDRLGE